MARTSRYGRTGFTLVELLVVISIISIMSSLTMSYVRLAQAEARDTRRYSDIENMVVALEQYYQDKGHFPCSGLRTSLWPLFMQELLNGKYLNTRPKDPINSGGFVYAYYSFKTEAGGPCGQIAAIDYYAERAPIRCNQWAKQITPTHCHVFYPKPLPMPPCSNSYLENDSLPPPGCASLYDSS